MSGGGDQREHAAGEDLTLATEEKYGNNKASNKATAGEQTNTVILNRPQIKSSPGATYSTRQRTQQENHS